MQLTILEVFIHDPLYRWMLSPFDARKRQREKDGEKVSNNQKTTCGSRIATRYEQYKQMSCKF